MLGSLMQVFIYFVLGMAFINLYNAIMDWDFKVIIAMLVIIVPYFVAIYYKNT